MIGEPGRNETNSKNPFVLLSRNDFEVAEVFLKQNQNLRSVPNKRTVSRVKTKMSHTSKYKGKEKNDQETKQCLLCRTSSLSDGEINDISGSRFNLYKKLVQTLDFNHGLPHVQYIDEKLQFCCQDCYKAVHQLWELQQILEEIKREMTDIVESMKKAIEIKRPVVLKNKSSIFLLSRGRDKRCSSVRSETSVAISDESVQIHSTQTERETNFSSSFLMDFAHLETENENVLGTQDNTRKSSDLHSPKQILTVADDHEEVIVVKMEPIYFDDDDLDSCLTNNDNCEFEILPDQDLNRPVRSSKLRAKQFLQKLANEDGDLEETDSFESTKQITLSKNMSAGSHEEDTESIHKDEDDNKYSPELSDNSIHSEIDSDEESITSKDTDTDCSEDSPSPSNPSASRNKSSTEIEQTQNGQKLSESSEIHIQEVGKRSKPHKCSYCKLAFSSSFEKMRHFRNKHKKKKSKKSTQNKLNYCDKCKMSFYSSTTLKTHNKRVHEKLKPHHCEHCEFRSFTEYDLNRHVRAVHFGEKLYACRKGSKLFTNKHSQLQHQKIICGTNEEERENRNDQQRRSRSAAREKGYKCPKCKLYFLTEFKLKLHIKRLHGNNDNPVAKPTFSCDQCEKVYKNQLSLTQHIERLHKNIKSHKCPTCELEFYTVYYMKRHIQTVHEKIQTIKPKPNKSHQCDQCGALYYNSTMLRQHTQRIHEGLKPNQCEHCKYRFFRKSDLNRHVQTVHLGVKPFQCSKCLKRFTSVSYLREHEKIVCGGDQEAKLKKKEKQLELKCSRNTEGQKCPKCKLRFIKVSNLERHIKRAHPDGEETMDNFVMCELCGKSLKSINLLKHTREIHEGVRRKSVEEKGHICNLCDKSFPSQCRLKRHIKVHASSKHKENRKTDNGSAESVTNDMTVVPTCEQTNNVNESDYGEVDGFPHLVVVSEEVC